MGEYVNTKTYNVIAWGTVMVVIVLTIIIAITALVPVGT